MVNIVPIRGILLNFIVSKDKCGFFIEEDYQS